MRLSFALLPLLSVGCLHLKLVDASVKKPSNVAVYFNVTDDNIYLCHRQTQLRRVFHEGAALEPNATAIVTERRSFRPQVTLV